MSNDDDDGLNNAQRDVLQDEAAAVISASKQAADKGKAPKADVDESEDDEVDFEAEEESDSASSSSSSSSSEEEDAGGVGGEEEGLEGGPSTAKKRRKVEFGDEPAILEGLSGDEVDPHLILAERRRGRRGRAAVVDGSGTSAKYTAEALLDSDEDDW